MTLSHLVLASCRQPDRPNGTKRKRKEAILCPRELPDGAPGKAGEDGTSA